LHSNLPRNAALYKLASSEMQKRREVLQKQFARHQHAASRQPLPQISPDDNWMTSFWKVH